MQPLQYDLRDPAAKDNSITHAAAAPSNLDAAITMRSEGTDSKHPITTHAQAHPKQLEATVTLRQEKRQTERSRNRRTDEVPFIAGCSHFTRKNTRFRASASSRKQSPCNIMQPLHCDLQPQIPKHPITTHAQAHPKQLEATVTMRQEKRQTDRSRNRRTDEVPFIAGCSHFTRKNVRFRASASSRKQSPCNIMQPLHCDLQPQIPKHPITTHTQAHPKQLEATVTIRQEKRQTDRSRNRRTDEVPFIAGCNHFTRKNARFRAPAFSRKQSPCNIMQPLCDLKAQIPKHPITTRHKHTQSSLKPPLQCGKRKRQTDRSRNRRTDEVPFIAGCSHFTRKNTRFRAPASSPKQSPCNIMQPFQCDLQAQFPKHPITTQTQAHPTQLEATVTMRQKKRQTDRSRNRRTDEVPFIAGCSHFTRKNTRFRSSASSRKQSPCNIMQPLQCDLQPQIPKHPITTHAQAHPKQLEATVTMRQKKRQTDRSRNRRTDEVPFIAGCSHFTRKNTRFRAPASSPKQSPCNIHAAIPMRSATTASTNAQNYAHRNNHRCKTHRRNQTTPAAPAAHTRYLSSPAAATLHGKTQGFVLWLPPHNIAHATFMQP